MEGAGKFVMIVDDDPDSREILYQFLAGKGFEIATVDCGAECLKTLQRRPVDLLLLDLRMPGLDGMEVLEHITRTWPQIRVVVVSAYGDWETYFEATGKGAVDVLQKPLIENQLGRVVEAAFRRGAPASEASLAPTKTTP